MLLNAQLAAQRNLAPVLLGELPHGIPQLPRAFDLIKAFDVIIFSSERAATGRVSLPFGISLAAVLSPQTGKA